MNRIFWRRFGVLQMMNKDPVIRIGTSGFSYKHWKVLFYPATVKTSGWLEYYATFFDITEINASFYHLPKTETVAAWAKRVPAAFTFCPKMSRYLTHMKKLNDPEESFERFFETFTPLKRKLGPVLIQLPPALAFEHEKAETLYKLCRRKYAYYSFAMEVRHVTWLSGESIALMKQYNIAFVISQSEGRFPYEEFVTAQHIYIRFHGPRELYASSYSDEDLLKYATMFKEWKKNGHTVWAFFNNDIHGYAIDNAKTLLRMCS